MAHARSAYLDHNASSPLRAVASQAMARFLLSATGNPSSVHAPGRRARAALDRARAELARVLGCSADEIVFTSGGTESNNLGILGSFPGRGSGNVVTSAIEHPCVLGSAKLLADRGFETRVAPVNSEGLLSEDDFRRLVSADTRLVSVQLANHEVGAVQDIARVADIVHKQGVLLHVDAVQALGKLPLNASALQADLVSVSSHKVGGPAGIGALFVRHGMPLCPVFGGGAQEGGLRPGTPPVALAVGFAAAAQEAARDLLATSQRHEDLRENLVAGLPAAWGTVVNGPSRAARTHRLSNTINISFPSCDREKLLIGLDLEGVHVSSGAACSSGSVEPSPVLLAMGLDERRVACAIRVSFGPTSSAADVERLLSALQVVVPRAQTGARFF